MEDKDLQDALGMAKPGRLLSLDDKGNMSAKGVNVTIHAIVTLARAYQEQQPLVRAALAKASVTDLKNCDEWDRQIRFASDSMLAEKKAGK